MAQVYNLNRNQKLIRVNAVDTMDFWGIIVFFAQHINILFHKDSFPLHLDRASCEILTSYF